MTPKECEALGMGVRAFEYVQNARKRSNEVVDELLTDELLEIGRKAIEDTLVEWRDSRLSECLRGNGLVIREKDGKDSSIIRFGAETALRIGIQAMAQAFKRQDQGRQETI